MIWITGLSGSGKSTLAAAAVSGLRERYEHVVLLDGDELRSVFGAADANNRNHGREGRLGLALQYGRLCRVVAAQGFTVVIATISMFHEVHAWNRENLPGYLEIYLKVPEAELRRRDPKGIYRRFDAGELADVAGFDLAVDEPQNPDWLVTFDPDKTAAELAQDLIKIISHNYTND